MKFLRRFLLSRSLASSCLCGFLAGCGVGIQQEAPRSSALFQGSVHGGQQPVAGASIQLYGVGAGNDGGTAIPLMTVPSVSNANGQFSFGSFTCPSASTLVYLAATGGNPGLAAGVQNAQLAELAVLGPCGNITASTFVSVNELTTVAAVYGITPYLTGVSTASSSAANLPALTNGFALSGELVSTASGSAPGTGAPAGSVVPVAEINTLADIIASCVNSSGGVAGDQSPCGQFLALTTVPGSPAPTDTVAGLINLANYPTLNTVALFQRMTAAAPFQPALSGAPADFSLRLTGADPTVPVASLLSASSGGGQSAGVNNGFAAPFAVRVVDAYAAPVAGVVVSFSAPASGPSVTLSSASCTTDYSGACSVTARANGLMGTYSVNASAGTLGAAFTLTNTGVHSYVVTVSTDATTGVASNCLDQPGNSGSANLNCSVRDALAAAAASASSSQPTSITFARSSAATITLAHGPLVLPSYTTLQGATAGSGIGLANLITIDGNNANGIFTQAAGVVQTTINNLILAHGYSSQVGGGIYSLGSLNVNYSTFFANQAALSGGAISNNGGVLTVFGSTFQGNIARSTSGFGGGIDNFGNGTVTVSNSTFTGNSGATGGAFYSSGTATILDSTIVGNTGSLGGGVYNKGVSFSISNSIVNGNGEDCGGIYCAPLYYYVQFGAATPSPVDTNSITIAFTDSLSNHFSQTVAYGQLSSSASVASTFGPYFYENHSGLDTTPITGQSFGSLFVLSSENGATLSPFVITNPGRSFTATQVTYPNPLSIHNNVHGLTAGQINLSPLQNNGGPTQTMAPLAGSAARCVINTAGVAGTDQRGLPRSATVGSSSCQDAGAVQTRN